MFFRNLSVFRIPSNPIDSVALEKILSDRMMIGVGPTAPQSIGWVQPQVNERYAYSNANGQILVALGAEQRILPASVVRRAAQDRAKIIEETEGRRVGRKELRDLREALTIELLPKSHVQFRRTFAWIDPVNGWLVIDTGSTARAEELIEYLRKTTDQLKINLLRVNVSPSSAMTGWVAGNEAPHGFTIDQDIELRSAENALIRYARHSLEGKDIREHIAEGKVVTRLGMTWNDRISFVLNEKGQIKRLAFLDILKEENECQAENEQERFDLDFALMTGELALMLKSIVESLGGES